MDRQWRTLARTTERRRTLTRFGLRRGALGTLAAAATALAVGGCALTTMPQPAAPGTTTARSAGVSGSAGGAGSAVATGAAVPPVTDNEVATPPSPEEHAPAAASAPAALRRFALGYINWDAADVRARLERLAADSVGQARSEMTLAAGQTGADPELAQAGVANHGTVEAVAALSGGGDRYVVVTRESTTATDSSAYQGLAPAWHLTVATVARRRGGWVVSGWQPEN
jgi:hypothetical protein